MTNKLEFFTLIIRGVNFSDLSALWWRLSGGVRRAWWRRPTCWRPRRCPRRRCSAHPKSSWTTSLLCRGPRWTAPLAARWQTWSAQSIQLQNRQRGDGITQRCETSINRCRFRQRAVSITDQILLPRRQRVVLSHRRPGQSALTMFWCVSRAESLHFGRNWDRVPAPAAECWSADVLLMQRYQPDGTALERK